jgi:hypothetical protein
MECLGCSGLVVEGKNGFCLACCEDLDRLVFLAARDEELRLELEADAMEGNLLKGAKVS